MKWWHWILGILALALVSFVLFIPVIQDFKKGDVLPLLIGAVVVIFVIIKLFGGKSKE